MNNETNTVLEPKPMSDFVETAYIKDITERSLTYIKAGFPVHFRGPSGTGKTTVAMHLASKIGRPVVIIHGDAEYKTSDLVGSESGYRFKKLDDRFIHSVHKVEEDMEKKWVNNRLTIAVKNGFTLIYDEFTRSRAEANNILLPILQEKMMSTSAGKEEDYYMKVHPEFRAIFTSNPEEYAGVNRTQDALRDRMVTMDLDHFDYETELQITRAKSNLTLDDAEKIIKIVRGLRESGKTEFDPTVRGSIMIAKTLATINATPSKNNEMFRLICQDILTSETSRVGSKTNQEKVRLIVNELIEKNC
ncbi:gas vesicle protein GvpN [Flavobacterium sp. GSP27]|uniref:Gas vesicle protein GvpN n=3 Tax=Flavobacteriaceae TaxID=49546 RepID=A0A432CMY9_9FLAO|nr:gas vesicle protein GvpN [Flavobacterium sp. LB2P53]RTY73524.1 gas vesicle protein GvpN [Flavobacterium sp. LS1R10]RTY81648.1 gas vesicle protein GvpN [Flavobacterium sp. ZB4P23]RTY81771.1 gas vesicle protein GvpN [Flavobacterium sp. LS1P28]RTY91680.1 gas vesicle protein GvpN [Flavobacterium sp. RSP46]RTY94844.1 gas vesicle protein GvpN [Flavobacterium sp. GSN2]RTZ04940.1 gas vesicle protein GvpN [Flavobacterium bomense]RTZ07636.1 gas vesicle protein GvpN [Flavobacterium sp. GSP6]RTZ0999